MLTYTYPRQKKHWARQALKTTSRAGAMRAHIQVASLHPVTRRSFCNIWKHLVKRGWDVVEARLYHPRAETTWYFIRPNVRDVLAAKRGRDCFATPDEVMDRMDDNPHVTTV
ncbi:hypothetical protein MHU86_1709 [Fragilaria crotonensis]|nr:hypothetical protein MHU86_1709 [Fragilaria crotonensis]